MKRNSIFRLLVLAGLSFAASTAVAYDRTPLTFGSIVRFKHKATKRYLTATDENYTHAGSSTQPAVYCGDDKDTPYAQWIIKGSHNGDRWNFALSGGESGASMIGWPVKRDQIIRLENVGTGRNLHGHFLPSPITKQGEITNLGEGGLCNTDDNFCVEDNAKAGGSEYLASGYAVKLKHVNTKGALHSHQPYWWKDSKQEVTHYAHRDDNDWWIPELVQQPNANAKIAPVFASTRSVKLSYWTPVFWDSEMDSCTDKTAKRRIWTHAGSRYSDPAAHKPHDHCELLVGPWSDKRSQHGPSFFIIHNADNKFKTGSVNFGDRVKIMAVQAGAGYPDRSGPCVPFRYLWVHEWSRWGDSIHRDIVVTRPEHGQTQDDSAIFVFEPVIDGQTGEISTQDLVRIKNVGHRSYLWTHQGSRWGGGWWEILADRNHDDTWGAAHYGVERRVIFEKFRFLLAQPQTVADDAARSDLGVINNEIKDILGVEAGKQQAIALQAEKKQLEQQKAALQSQLDAAAAEAKRIQAITDKAHEAEKLAASQALQAAKDVAAAIQKQAADDAAKKIDLAQAAAQVEADKVAKMAAQLADMATNPIGFVKIRGKGNGIAFGLQDHEIEKIINNKGDKAKETVFDDFGVMVLADGSLAQFKHTSDPANPWEKVNLLDANGTAIKVAQAAVGMDGTTCVISADGKSLYGINWPGDKPAQMPNPKRGFEAANTKEAGRKKHAGRHRRKKSKKHGEKGNKKRVHTHKRSGK